MAMTAAQALERNRMYAAPAEPKRGVLTEKVITCEVTGRKSREWVGDKAVWMNAHKKPSYIMVRINNNPSPTPGGLTVADVTKVVSQ